MLKIHVSLTPPLFIDTQSTPSATLHHKKGTGLNSPPQTPSNSQFPPHNTKHSPPSIPLTLPTLRNKHQ